MGCAVDFGLLASYRFKTENRRLEAASVQCGSGIVDRQRFDELLQTSRRMVACGGGAGGT